MKLVTPEAVNNYLQNDITLHRLEKASSIVDADFVCEKWLRESQAKRCVLEELYGEIFASTRRLRILDIGGGLTSLTAGLAIRHDYTLVDLLAHENEHKTRVITQAAGRNFIVASDWATLLESQYDIILANDLFPNVDQRLQLFLNFMLPQTCRIKMSLTWYGKPRYYLTKRVDAEEIFCMLAWDSSQLRRVLSQFKTKILHPDFEILKEQRVSPYPNERQVCTVEFIGKLGVNNYEKQ